MFYPRFYHPAWLISRSLIFIVALFLVVALPALTNAQESTEAPVLQSVKDMVIVPEDSGVSIYASDPTSGAIFFLRRANENQASLNFSDFKLLVKTAPKYKRPHGLAYHDRKLFVSDPGANEIFEIDLSPGSDFQPKGVALHELIEQPQHLAVPLPGVLAVASNTELQYHLLDKNISGIAREDISNLSRLISDGRSVVVLARAPVDNLYRLDINRSAAEIAQRLSAGSAFTKVTSDEFRKRLSSIEDVALYRGVYYVAGKQQVLAFSRSQLSVGPGPQPLAVSLPKDRLKDIQRIAVSENSLYIVDTDKRILSVPRPVPIVVDFPKATANSVFQHIEIMGLMDKSGILAKRTIVAANANENINEFVRSELFAGLGAEAAQIDKTTLAAMSRLLCKLNGWTCEERITKAGIDVYKENVIAAGNEVIAPLFAVSGYDTQQVDAVGDGPIEFRDYLAKARVIPLSPQITAVAPGQLATIAQGQQTPTLSGQCEVGTSGVVTLPTSFPTEVVMSADDFTRQLNPKVKGSDLEKLGIAQVVARYSEVQYERLQLSSEEKYKACRGTLTAWPEDTYVVDRVLMAASGRYRFLDRRGRYIAATQALELLGFSGYADPSKQWTLILPTRLNLGYVAFRFLPSGSEAPRVSFLKPRVHVTKIHSHQLSLLVETSKASEAMQAVNDFAANKGVRLYASTAQDPPFSGSERSLRTFDLSSTSQPQGLTLDDAVKERRRLRDLIQFDPELSGLYLPQLRVGVVEDLTTIDVYHQSFYNDEGEWTWADADTDAGSGGPINASPREPGAVKSEAEFNPKDNPEHGTHVAAIIAAKSYLPGLLPSIGLVRISALPLHLRNDIKRNIRDVQIFNLSVSPAGTTADHAALIATIKNAELGQGNLLFVVAAGNAGDDYSTTALSPPLPVVWLRDIPNNMLVVGASSDSSPPRRLPNSNFSKKYLQLLAPGEKIFSATKGHTYAPASGTSQAAPQVTAAAALIRTKGLSAQWIKGVLIYTAGWREDLMEDAWGGILNVKRAYDSAAQKNAVWFDKQGPPEFIQLTKDYKIKIISGALINDPNNPKATLDSIPEDLNIPLYDILRIQQMDGPNRGLFRVIYLEKKTGEMTMLVKAKIQGLLRCGVLKDANDKPLGQCGILAEGKSEGEISFSSIEDYIRAVPGNYRQVTFASPK